MYKGGENKISLPFLLEMNAIKERIMEERIPKDLIKPIIKTYRKGAYIYKAGEPVRYTYFIVKGRIKIESISPTGKRLSKSILSNGELFGEMALFGEAKRRDYACTLALTVIHIYTKEEIQRLLKVDKKFQFLLLNKMANQVISMEHKLTSLVFNDSRSRVIAFLVQQGRKDGERIGFDTLLKNFLSHQEIAYFTATSRQTVNVVLNELRTQNLIHYHRKRLLIRDLDKLEEALIPQKVSIH